MRGCVRRGLWLVALATALGLPRGLGACGMQYLLESTPGVAAQEIAAGLTTTISLRTLYTVYFTIPVTDCFLLSCDVRIEGQAWDNGEVIPLQPMNKLVWVLLDQQGEQVTPEDRLEIGVAGTCRFSAAGIFRATESGTYQVTVTYRDESLAEPLVEVLAFEAR